MLSAVAECNRVTCNLIIFYKQVICQVTKLLFKGVISSHITFFKVTETTLSAELRPQMFCTPSNAPDLTFRSHPSQTGVCCSVI